jgi:MSHA biogenesis protein MshJ
LRRYPNLTLVQMNTLAPAAPAQPASAGALVPIAVARRGVEMTVTGPYAELMRMVQSLEKAMPTLRWGSMRLNANAQPPTLLLEVFVLGEPS